MTDVVVRRFLPLPRERVFAAWLDPASQAQWMLPGDVTTATIESDPRVGGQFRIVMEHGRGNVEHWGEYLTIDPPSLLSFTWISANTNFLPTIVTIELHERDNGTELILTHRGLPPEKLAPHEQGWSDIVRRAGETLTTS
jgi:uncharacterized protein YndB with AHSA1/START domain